MAKQKLTLEEVALFIHSGCLKLHEEVQKLEDLTDKSAECQSNYDKLLGLAVARRKAEGEAVSVIERLAKAECSEALLDKVVAEGRLKACYTVIDSIKARINAYQSINRYLADLPESHG